MFRLARDTKKQLRILPPRFPRRLDDSALKVIVNAIASPGPLITFINNYSSMTAGTTNF